MTILIIGNGFDLAHCLRTQYSDFLDFVKALNVPGDNDHSRFIAEIKERDEKLYSEIITLAENNVLINYFLSIYEDRCKGGKDGWIDFESEISNIVQKMDEAKQDIASKYSKINIPASLEKSIAIMLKPIIEGQNHLSLYIPADEQLYLPQSFDDLASRVLDALNRLTRLLEIYLYECIEKKDCSLRIPEIKEIKPDYVLSFNYTDTFRKYYDPENEVQYCYIHGKTKDGSLEECDLVLGIDEYLPPERRDTNNEFVWFKKFYQRIYKETGSEYQDWIKHFEYLNEKYKKANISPLELYIYGHSLDVTDKDVLSRLIMMDNTITHIFYHSREAMAKQISNLVKIIGEDNLIRKNGGKDRTILFTQSQAAVKLDGEK